ncbi:hypothetical protein GCM10025861_18750 [Methanobacterium petrolearium]|nr:hypothetical protein GCM10025861_18750 [Methanobacterium petrolearium]
MRTKNLFLISYNNEEFNMLDSFGTLLHGDPVDKAEVKRLRDLILFENTDLKKVW